MKSIFPLTLLLLSITACRSDPHDILAMAYEKCQSIKYGYYELDKSLKMMGSNDTIRLSQNTFYSKNSKDSIVPFKFNTHSISEDLGEMSFLYTGNDWVLYINDMGQRIQKNGNENDIWVNCIKNPAFRPYMPFTYADSSPLPNMKMTQPDDIAVKYVNKETINGMPCHHIKTTVQENSDYSLLKGHGIISKTEIDYWINMRDSIPVRFTATRYLNLADDTVTEFEDYVLTKYELPGAIEESIFTLASIPTQVDIHSPEPYVAERPLRIGDTAPDWRLASISGDTLSLSGLKGNLVLLDFFYCSCPTCLIILPDLRKLHEKYKDRGLHIVGLNSVDTKTTIEYFIERHGFDYPVLISDHNTNDGYGITAYPTTYLIGPEGTVLFRHAGGYNNAIIATMENIIQRYIH